MLSSRALGALTLVASLAFLTGCAPTSGSSLTVRYELGGREYTASLRPDEVDCGEQSVTALAIGDNGTTGTLTLRHPASDGEPGRATGGMGVGSDARAGDRLLNFEAEGVVLDTSVEGVVVVADTAATVRVYQEDDAPDFEAADAEMVDGTLSARLVCAR